MNFFGYTFLALFYVLVACAHYEMFGKALGPFTPALVNPWRAIWAIIWPIPLSVFLIAYFVLSRRLF